MLRHIRLGNYKSYQQAEIETKPITILCGANSSGKTAILKSILLMKQSFEATGDNYLLINGPYTQNGLFGNVKCNSSTSTEDSNMSISLSFVIEADTSLFKDICKSIQFSKTKDDIARFSIDANFAFTENPALSQIGEIDTAQITIATEYSQDAYIYNGDTVYSSIFMRKNYKSQKYTVELHHFPIPGNNSSDYYRFKYDDCRMDSAVCYFRGMQLVSLYQEGGISKAGMRALPVLYTIFRTITSELSRIKYIGPLRDAPSRQYFSQIFYSNIGVKGENTAQYLGQYGDSNVTVFLPQKDSLSTCTLKEAVAIWADYLGIEKVEVQNIDITGAKITQIMIGQQNIVDVGFGISQVLPILVEGLTMTPGSTLILEQPEIHLNPKMQMDIADFLLTMQKHGKNLIIETHSDHIINRIVRRSLEDKSIRDSVKIYYVEKDENKCSELSEIKLDEGIGVDEAPAGFFDQYAAETDMILRAGIKNLRAKRMQNHE